MAASIRSRRIAELQARAKRTDIFWHNRKYALLALTGTQRLGEKTIMWTQRLINECRDQYQDADIHKDLDLIQERLDRQRELLKRRIERKNAEQEEVEEEPISRPAAPGEDVWDQ